MAHLLVQSPQLIRQFVDVIRDDLADLIEIRAWDNLDRHDKIFETER